MPDNSARSACNWWWWSDLIFMDRKKIRDLNFLRPEVRKARVQSRELKWWRGRCCSQPPASSSAGMQFYLIRRLPDRLSQTKRRVWHPSSAPDQTPSRGRLRRYCGCLELEMTWTHFQSAGLLRSLTLLIDGMPATARRKAARPRLATTGNVNAHRET